MKAPTQMTTAVLSAASILFLVGCGGPPALKRPSIDPTAVAEGVIAAHDTDGDGQLSIKEASDPACGLRFSLRMIDGNGDGGLSSDEIRDYIQRFWIDMGGVVISTKCQVRYRNKPVTDVTVTFEPVDYLEGVIKPASGVARGGIVSLDLSDEDRPHPNAHGANTGLYVVRISKLENGQETFPAKYNTDSVLGCEVASRAGYKPGPVLFDLK